MARDPAQLLTSSCSRLCKHHLRHAPLHHPRTPTIRAEVPTTHRKRRHTLPKSWLGRCPRSSRCTIKVKAVRTATRCPTMATASTHPRAAATTRQPASTSRQVSPWTRSPTTRSCRRGTTTTTRATMAISTTTRTTSSSSSSSSRTTITHSMKTTRRCSSLRCCRRPSLVAISPTTTTRQGSSSASHYTMCPHTPPPGSHPQARPPHTTMASPTCLLLSSPTLRRTAHTPPTRPTQHSFSSCRRSHRAHKRLDHSTPRANQWIHKSIMPQLNHTKHLIYQSTNQLCFPLLRFMLRVSRFSSCDFLL